MKNTQTMPLAETETVETSTRNLQPATCNLHPTLIETRPLAPVSNGQRCKHRRHGRVACLPRVQRDMVNRMLWNGVPYKNIVSALDDAGFSLNEKNISNW